MHSHDTPTIEIAKAFLDVLARWPWPVPFTTENMLAISKKERVTKRRLDSRRFVSEWQSSNKHREPPLSHTVCCTFAARRGDREYVHVEHDAVCSAAAVGWGRKCSSFFRFQLWTIRREAANARLRCDGHLEKRDAREQLQSERLPLSRFPGRRGFYPLCPACWPLYLYVELPRDAPPNRTALVHVNAVSMT